MANPYDGLWDWEEPGASPWNPIQSALLTGSPLDTEAAREAKRRQMAEARTRGDLGTVPTPDTSAGAIAREALGMFGASAVENIANTPRQVEQVLATPGNALRSRAGLPPQQLASERGAPGALLATVDQNYAAHQQRLASAAQDLPAPVSAGLYVGTELAGQAVEPTNIAAGAILRTPRAAPALADNPAAEYLSKAIFGREVEAAVQRGVEPVSPGFGTAHDAAAYGAWLDRVGIPARDGVLPGLQDKFFELHHPDLPELPPAPLPQDGPGVTVNKSGYLPTSPEIGGIHPSSEMPPIPPRLASEAGFIRNPWAPEPDLYRQTYNIRHDFVTEQGVAVRQSAVRASALQAAIPDRALREDMTAVFHGTGNPLIKGDTPQTAASRLAASPHAQEADQAVAAWRQRSDELWKMAREAGADDLGYFKNYLHMVYDAPKGEQAIRGSAFSEGPTTSVMRERAFENPSEAMARGYKPKSLDFSVLMHETERAHAHTRAILGLMDDIGAVNEQAVQNALKVGPMRPEDFPSTPIVRAAVNPDPAQYVRVEGFPILDRAAPGKVDPEAVQMAKKLASEAGQANAAAVAQRTVQPSLPGLESLGQQPMEVPGIPETPPNIYVHRDVWRNLMPVLKSDDPVALDGLLSTVKRVNFLGSLFHGLSLTEAAIKDMGPLRGTYEAGRRGFGIPGLSQLAAKLGGGKLAEDSIEAAIRDGVNVDMPKLDAMSGTFEEMLRNTEGKLRTGGNPLAPRNAMASALAGLRKTSAYYDEALWANYHAPLKVTAHELSLARVAKKMGLTVADLPQDVRQSVAQFTNDAFGGQNWQLLHSQLLSDPVAQRWMRRVFLSPDWNVSAISTGLSPFSSDPTRRLLGRNYWKNATGLLTGYAALNYALSGHPMWENESGHKFDLETGMTDENGRKIFFQVGKHARETPEFFLGRGHEPPVAGFLLRKLNSPLRGLLTATTGYSPGGFPGALADAKDDADKEARDLTKMEDLTARARDLGSGALPFVAQKPDPAEIARKLVIPFVQTKGMSLHEGRNEIADAFREGDTAHVRQIRQWLHENGYSGEQINRAVSGAYRGIAMEKKRKGAAPGPMPDAPIDQPATPNPYDGLW